MHTEAARKKLFLSNSTGQRFTLLGASVDMNFAAGAYFGGTVATMTSTTRASSGYAQTAAGLLVNFAANTPRITDQGLLVEEARTNLALRSNEFSNASWTKTTGGTGSVPTLTADTDTAPDGTLTADRAVFTLNGGTASGDLSQLGQTITVLNATVYTFSFWGKSRTAGSFAMQIINGNAVGSAITVTPTWQRFVVTYTSSSTSSFVGLRLRGGQTPVNDNTADIAVWGGQLEAGAFVTSNIDTTTASATRAADVITLTGAAATAVQGVTGSILAQTNTLVNGTGTYSPYIVGGNDQNNNAFIRVNTATTSYSKFANTVLNSTLGSGAYNTGRVKTGVAWSAAGRSLVANNGTVATDANAPTAPTTTYLGSVNGSAPACGYIERVTIWTSRLADATIKALSA